MRLLTEAAIHGSTDGTWVIVAALIGVIPGLIAFMVSAKTRREHRANQVDQVGLAYTQTAFKSLEKEVGRMSTQVQNFGVERELWDHDRTVWAEDKRRLLRRIAELTEQLHVTNGYLRLILVLLDAHGIPAPKPPASLTDRTPGLDG